MFKKSFYLLPVLATALFASSCKNLGEDKFAKTPSGLEYKLYSQNKDGKYEAKEFTKVDSTKLGKVMSFEMEYRNSKDSVLFNSKDNAMPIQIKLVESPNKGSIEEAFLMLDKGDSAVFKINADSLFAKTFKSPLPPFIEKGSFLTFFVKSINLQTEQEAMADYPKMMERQQKELEARAAKQGPLDDKKIQEYIKENKLDAKKTASGVYYVITQPGTGANAADGKMVSVQYKGTLLNGKEFDSSAKSNGGNPIEFPLGQGQVIKGWEDGIKQFNKGSKGVLLIPSPQGYGSMARGADLPANSILRFDIELVDIKDMPAGQPAMPGAQPGM
ncbi:FKBP-type peptidyl-prolyl cis-trans isomerase [Rufibacter quisquiliarum]|uniref:peptidylprolyl isomerase n=1 Tax=Rufibacter quisquiliarum TaxID=1549639 RepID=A0A839GAQ0_9BACT|nr:FKBP-type peptidyl-prolyl cis-trans isomerase [Rufibacter quisquiliarum]MBA9076614.1 FKBP-type peptidyl-prolyl cis-trans isomerase [Rufibacter quisquiliarum]